MATDHILSLLISERDKLNRAIEALQGPTKRRGRPPKNPHAALVAAPEPPTEVAATQRKPRTEEQRAAQALRMKKYWAKRKKAQKA